MTETPCFEIDEIIDMVIGRAPLAEFYLHDPTDPGHVDFLEMATVDEDYLWSLLDEVLIAGIPASAQYVFKNAKMIRIDSELAPIPLDQIELADSAWQSFVALLASVVDRTGGVFQSDCGDARQYRLRWSWPEAPTIQAFGYYAPGVLTLRLSVGDLPQEPLRWDADEDHAPVPAA